MVNTIKIILITKNYQIYMKLIKVYKINFKKINSLEYYFLVCI